MAGKRRAYAVLVSNEEAVYNESLCWDRDSEGYAIYGTRKQAEARVDKLVSNGYARSGYTIVKAELK